MGTEINNPLSIIDHPFQRGLERARDLSSSAPNKANHRRFWARNGSWVKKQSQFLEQKPHRLSPLRGRAAGRPCRLTGVSSGCIMPSLGVVSELDFLSILPGSPWWALGD